jgi:FtsH-binding integral membrane protein
MISCIVARYFAAGAGVIVLEAFALTALVFVTITAYIMISKKDFSFLGGFLFAALIILFVASIANFVFGFVGVRNKVVTFAISVLGALVFTGYLLYDTSLVVRRSLLSFTGHSRCLDTSSSALTCIDIPALCHSLPLAAFSDHTLGT